MPLVAKIAFTVAVVLWTTFLCTVGRRSLTWFHDSIFCRRGNLVGKFIFTDAGEIRPIRVIFFFGLMLVLVWLDR
jgi:hypothetical protein